MLCSSSRQPCISVPGKFALFHSTNLGRRKHSTPAGEGLIEGTGHFHIVVDRDPKEALEQGDLIPFDATVRLCRLCSMRPVCCKRVVCSAC